MKKTILLPDLHYPLHTQEIYNKILKVIKAEKIKDVVLLGDAQDMSSINHWEKEKGNLRGFEGKRLIKDYMNFDKDILKPLEKLGCNIVYMEGNHEYWVEDVVDKNPQLEGLIEYYNILDFKKRNIKFIRWIEKNGGRGYYDIGKLRLIHGEYTGQYHASKTSNSYSKNVVYGHTHDIQSFTKITNDGDIHQAQSIGCLCQLSPGYMKGRPNKWVNGFGVLYTRDDGTFNVYTVIISNNKFTFNDKTY